MSKTAVAKKKKSSVAGDLSAPRQMAAGEFKAKVLGLIDEVSETGRPVVVTKRGKPKAKLVPYRAPKKNPFFGRLKGVMEIVGDPGDLVKPIIPLEDWDMLK